MIRSAPEGARTLHHELSEFRDARPGQSALDLARLASGVEALIRAAPAHGPAYGPASAQLAPAGRGTTDLTFDQTARALRFALTQFAQDGAQRTRSAGQQSGLAGYIVQAGTRARAARELIARRRFRLVFQPVVTLADRRVHHYEALLRPLPAPGAPPRTPQEFVSFSEEMGLAEELDLAVLEEATATLAHVPGAAIAVNVSGLSMQSPAFRERMLAIAVLHPGRLLVELTETAEIEDIAGATATLDRLRAVGIPVCIDDFGAGGAAFRYLRDFRVDYVKIDGAYVRGATRNERDRGFVESMLDLARSVGAKVIAEMIETEEEARLMRQLGVPLGQGWLFGRAASLVPTANPVETAGQPAQRLGQGSRAL